MLINITDAAHQAGVSDKTLRRAIAKGALIAQPYKANQQIMIDVDDLEAYIASRRGDQPDTAIVQRTNQMDEIVRRLAVLEERVTSLLQEQKESMKLIGDELTNLNFQMRILLREETQRLERDQAGDK